MWYICIIESYSEPYTYNDAKHRRGDSKGHTHVCVILRTPKIIPESQNGEGGENVWGRRGKGHILKLDGDGAK